MRIRIAIGRRRLALADIRIVVVKFRPSVSQSVSKSFAAYLAGWLAGWLALEANFTDHVCTFKGAFYRPSGSDSSPVFVGILRVIPVDIQPNTF